MTFFGGGGWGWDDDRPKTKVALSPVFNNFNPNDNDFNPKYYLTVMEEDGVSMLVCKMSLLIKES